MLPSGQLSFDQGRVKGFNSGFRRRRPLENERGDLISGLLCTRDRREQAETVSVRLEMHVN